MAKEKVKRNKAIVELIDNGAKPIWVANYIGLKRERIRQIYKKETGINPSDRQNKGLINLDNDFIKHARKVYCRWCGEKFYRHKSKRTYYCSEDCYRNSHKRSFYKSDIRTCEICGVKFFPFRNRKYQFKHSAFLCDSECRIKYMLIHRRIKYKLKEYKNK